ncbi:MAG: relaxase, partial [Pseudomonadota bacterium]
MILVGNQRGGGADLARHLMKAENERVVVHEVRGFASTDLAGAFHESYAISRGTRCKQHLYSLSLNPPLEAEATPELLLDAVNRVEKRLGLTGEPRAVVFHEKRGMDGQLRSHAHAVWCRIDADRMRAVQMSFDRSKLQAVARGLYLDHGWAMPRGFVRHEERNPRNY